MFALQRNSSVTPSSDMGTALWGQFQHVSPGINHACRGLKFPTKLHIYVNTPCPCRHGSMHTTNEQHHGRRAKWTRVVSLDMDIRSRNGANGDHSASLRTGRPLASIIQMKETKGRLLKRTIEFHKRSTSRQWGITWPACKINIRFTSPVD